MSLAIAPSSGIVDPEEGALSTARRRRALLLRSFRRGRGRGNRAALLLLMPLLLFLALAFLLPLVLMMRESIIDRDLRSVLPRTSELLQTGPWGALPSDQLVQIFSSELAAAQRDGKVGTLARRLNTEIPGFRSLFAKTASAAAIEAPASLDALARIDPRWAEPSYWSAMKNAAAHPSDYFLLSALDLRRDTEGTIKPVAPEVATFVPVLLRTLAVAMATTLVSAAVGIPVAYLLLHLSGPVARIAFFLVLLPFWTSALVRITGWTVLLQRDGIASKLAGLVLPGEPVSVMYTSTSMMLGTIHLMLPFMIIPVYAAMRRVDPATIRAALSLGARPSTAFWRVFLPQCIGGIGAGSAIVFILTLGSYTTPALLGGPGNQMLSYFIAFYTKQMLNWNMASALSVVLLVMTLAACWLGSRFFRTGSGS